MRETPPNLCRDLTSEQLNDKLRLRMTQHEITRNYNKYGTFDCNWSWELVKEAISDNLINYPGFKTCYEFQKIKVSNMEIDRILELMENHEKKPDFFIISGVVNSEKWYPDVTDRTDGENKHCVAFQVSTAQYWEPYMQEVKNGSSYLDEGKTHAYPIFNKKNVIQRAPIFMCEGRDIEYRFFRKIFTVHRINFYQSPVDVVDLTNEDTDYNSESNNESYSYHSASSSSSSSISSSSTFEIENAYKKMKTILF
jgi:hypothetical protein